MAKYLVIVESPAKVKTIKKFLGANYEVDASNGHVRDLPKSQLGVDIENNYEPKYITIRGKGDVLAKLRKEVKKAEKPAPKPQPAPRKAAPAPKNQTITNFVVFVRDGGATIRLDASSPIRFKHLELTSPSRVVVDLHGTWKLSEPGVPKGEMVKDVRLGKKGSDTRIVIDLHAKAKTRYILTKGKKRLDIRLDKTK